MLFHSIVLCVVRSHHIPAGDEEPGATHECQRFPSNAFSQHEQEKENKGIKHARFRPLIRRLQHPEKIEDAAKETGDTKMVKIPEKLIIGPVKHARDAVIEDRGERPANDKNNGCMFESRENLNPVDIAHVGAVGVTIVSAAEDVRADPISELTYPDQTECYSNHQPDKHVAPSEAADTLGSDEDPNRVASRRESAEESGAASGDKHHH